MSEYNKAIRRSVVNIWRGMQHDPVKIKKDGRVTVVFWKDGTTTAVRCGMDQKYDSYMAFCAALGKKVFGSNSALKRAIYDTPNEVVDPILLDSDGFVARSKDDDVPYGTVTVGDGVSIIGTNHDPVNLLF